MLVLFIVANESIWSTMDMAGRGVHVAEAVLLCNPSMTACFDRKRLSVWAVLEAA
jgi:hypothetical protein